MTYKQHDENSVLSRNHRAGRIVSRLAHVANGQRPNHPAAINNPNAVTITTTGQFGSPLPGLTATELTNFAAGQAQFETFDAVAPDGLGPIFNAQACVACHTQPNTSANPVITPPVGGNVTTAVVSGITPGGLVRLRRFGQAN